MKHSYQITLPTRDIFNFIVVTVIRQFDENPEILKAYGASEFQLTDLRISCTTKEAFIIKTALADYISEMVRIDESGHEIRFWERMAGLWNQNTTSLLF